MGQFETALSWTVGFYALALLGFWISDFWKPKGMATLASWIARGGWVAQTVALAIRWHEKGAFHPPWIQASEILFFSAWALVGAHLFTEIKYKARWAGTLVFPAALAVIATAYFLPHAWHSGSVSVAPELHSKWIFVHVALGCLAYGFFAVSVFLSIFYLVKDEVTTDSMLAGLSALGLLLLFKMGIGRQREMLFPTLAFGAFAMHFLFYGVEAVMAGVFPRSSRISRRIVKWTLIADRSFYGFGIFAALFLVATVTSQGASKDHPYEIGALFFLSIVGLFGAGLLRWRPSLEEQLPSLDKLDRWCYQAALVGFMLLTLTLVSGAIWAYFAWGRYWGWDPKETWTLVTWVFYAIYLHLRVSSEWSGRSMAVLSLMGLFVVGFTFLGTNLLLPGLHVYAIR